MTTMQIDRAVVEQALEVINDTAYGAPVFRQEVRDTITALRAALAQEQAEPQRTSAWWRDGLTATLMREGVNKHRAREIADGYWQAYCEIGGNDD